MSWIWFIGRSFGVAAVFLSASIAVASATPDEVGAAYIEARSVISEGVPGPEFFEAWSERFAACLEDHGVASASLQTFVHAVTCANMAGDTERSVWLLEERAAGETQPSAKVSWLLQVSSARYLQYLEAPTETRGLRCIDAAERVRTLVGDGAWMGAEERSHLGRLGRPDRQPAAHRQRLWRVEAGDVHVPGRARRQRLAGSGVPGYALVGQ